MQSSRRIKLLFSQLADSYILLTEAGRKNNERKNKTNGRKYEVNVEFSAVWAA